MRSPARRVRSDCGQLVSFSGAAPDLAGTRAGVKAGAPRPMGHAVYAGCLGDMNRTDVAGINLPTIGAVTIEASEICKVHAGHATELTNRESSRTLRAA